jgi:hypothetical protein
MNNVKEVLQRTHSVRLSSGTHAAPLTTPKSFLAIVNRFNNTYKYQSVFKNIYQYSELCHNAAATLLRKLLGYSKLYSSESCQKHFS